MLRLTDLLGAPVTAGGVEIGSLSDLGVGADGDHPALDTVDVRRRGSGRAAYPLSSGSRIAAGAVALGDVGPLVPDGRRPLMLRSHVLDAQVIDLAGKRVVRVGDVILGGESAIPRLVAIEFGLRPLLARLGLRRLAERHAARTVDWADVHLVSGPGHALQLDMAGAAIHSLDAAELAAVIAHLPPPRAREAIRATGAPPTAARPRTRRGRRFGRVMRARRRAPS